MAHRREFLKQAVAAGSALALGATRLSAESNSTVAVKSLRVLILDSTEYVARHQVRAAVARGHRVTVLNHEQDPADLPAAVERLVGDRIGQLDAIKNREWDAVLDLATTRPGWVRHLGEVLKDRVKHYTLLSHIRVYNNPGDQDTITEASPILTYTGSTDPYSATVSVEQFGALKALCEREAERQFPGRTLILRRGYVAGPEDHHSLFIYWPLRLGHGGEVLAAGVPAMPLQFIDARDLAAWTLRLIEDRITGIYNAVGPTIPTTFGQLIAAAGAAVGNSASVTWVPPAWLATQPNPELWSNLLFWASDTNGLGGRMRMSTERARDNGLTTRPLSDTLRDMLAWFRQQPLERQAGLLQQWKNRANGAGQEMTAIPWPDYLDRERAVLATWREQQRKQQ